MKTVPARAILKLIQEWKEQEADYKREGLISECGALMMHRVELEELLSKHGVSRPSTIDTDPVEFGEYGLFNKEIVLSC
tara:strand:- start:6303 stop:6539 length:237 start_codon:yes stop_codon:yes gene_type:complete